jgi:hypothetical protein
MHHEAVIGVEPPRNVRLFYRLPFSMEKPAKSITPTAPGSSDEHNVLTAVLEESRLFKAAPGVGPTQHQRPLGMFSQYARAALEQVRPQDRIRSGWIRLGNEGPDPVADLSVL